MEFPDIFLDDCRFAKVVMTARGPALLIGYTVIEIVGSGSEWGNEVVDLLSRALRGPREGCIGSAEAQQAEL